MKVVAIYVSILLAKGIVAHLPRLSTYTHVLNIKYIVFAIHVAVLTCVTFVSYLGVYPQ